MSYGGGGDNKQKTSANNSKGEGEIQFKSSNKHLGCDANKWFISFICIIFSKNHSGENWLKLNSTVLSIPPSPRTFSFNFGSWLIFLASLSAIWNGCLGQLNNWQGQKFSFQLFWNMNSCSNIVNWNWKLRRPWFKRWTSND